jgi:hypothetical protein
MKSNRWKESLRDAAISGMALWICASMTGCLVVGGSSRGGFFIWPGSLGLLVVLVLIFALMRRR